MVTDVKTRPAYAPQDVLQRCGNPRRPAPDGVASAEWTEVRPALRAALSDAIAQQAWPIVMFGVPGTGKTCAAAAVFRAWRAEPAWWPAQKLLRLMADIRRSSTGFVEVEVRGHITQYWERTLLKSIEQAPLVVLDDIGIRTPTPAMFDALMDVLNARADKPLIVTSNLHEGALEQAFDARIVSRLFAGQAIEFKGDDRRIRRQIKEVVV